MTTSTASFGEPNTTQPPPHAPSREVILASDLHGPEGPLFVDGMLYFVTFATGTLAKWDGKRVTTVATYKDCAANGLAPTKAKTLLLACSDEHGAILEVDVHGKELRRWTTDSKGAAFVGGVNDLVMTVRGGAYATVFGIMGPRPGEIIGRVLYLAPGAKSWVEVVNDINYANGVGVSPDQKTLYVAEQVGDAILKFTIEPDGSLSHRTTFALLSRLTPETDKSWWIGPDSMKVDRHGNLFVAQWFGGKILKIAPDGTLLHEFPVTVGTGTTNVALDEGEQNLFVTVVASPIDFSTWKGALVKIPNDAP